MTGRGKTDLSCGTQACALGWATTIPSIRRAGLILQKYRYSNGGFISLRGNDTIAPLAAAAQVFGITYDDANHLFMPHERGENEATAADVAAKIERFVENRKPTN
jgi:hypothetical protein